MPDFTDLDAWKHLCSWLDARHRKCAYGADFPPDLAHLGYIGGNATGAAARDARYQMGLIVYEPGWGWRLRAAWRERLAAHREQGQAAAESGAA